MRRPLQAVAEVLMRHGDYEETPDSIEWLQADVAAVMGALAGGPDVVDTIPENAVYMALFDTAWFDATQPDQVLIAQAVACEVVAL